MNPIGILVILGAIPLFILGWFIEGSMRFPVLALAGADVPVGLLLMSSKPKR